MAAALAPLCGCQSKEVRLAFNVAPDVNAPDDSPGTLPRSLELAVVTVKPADMKNAANRPLDPNRPSADSAQWFQASSSAAGAYALPREQVYYLSDDERFGVKLGRWLVWRPSEDNIYEYTVPIPSGTNGLLIFARYLDAQNNIRHSPPLVIKNPGRKKGTVDVRVERDRLTLGS